MRYETADAGGAGRVHSGRPRVERDAASAVRQIATAMEHLHSKKILHRDLKSANVLVAEDGRLVVADFGLARYCGECCRVEPHIPPHGSDVLAVPLTALRVPLAAAQSRTPKLT